MSRATREWLPLGAFVALAAASTFPLVRHLSTALPGAGLGDNVTFLWNFWWMRAARAAGTSFFRTSFLFAPVGAGLALDSHTALSAFAGATVFGRWPIVEARNLLLLIEWTLNGWAAYALARRLKADPGAAFVGGLIFAGSPYIAAHLGGHFNLTAAWTIPLFAIAASEAATGAIGWALTGGVVLGATFFVDYYYVVFEVALGLAFLAAHAGTYACSPRGWSRSFGRTRHAVLALVLLDGALMIAIAATGGIAPTIAGRQVNLHDTYNGLQMFWALGALWIVLRIQPRLVIRRRREWPARRAAGAVLVLTVAALLVAAPLLTHAWQLVRSGDYTTQRYAWRSAPSGIDVASLFLGNPFHGLWGHAVARLYAALRINIVESGAWLGVVPMLLAAHAVRREWGDPHVRRWAAIGGMFFVWALGPHLIFAGRDTAMILPDTLIRYIPFAANARIPGRAMVVAYLALAMLSAKALTSIMARSPRPAVWLLGAIVLIGADYEAAPLALAALDHPHVYDVLRGRPERGAVCELPLGIADGFGETGHLDRRVLYYQTIHERPIVGGFVARLPASVVEAYRSDPLLSSLMRLSEGRPEDEGRTWPPRDRALDRFRQDGIEFVVLNRETAPAGLQNYVDHVLPLDLIAHDGVRDLFVVSAR